MRLKSPTAVPISFGTISGSGHCMVLGPEGEEVPKMFLQPAFAAGAIPADMDAEDFVAAPPDTPTKSSQELIQAAIKTMLERTEPDDFTVSGLPNRRALAKLVGLNVTAEEAAIAWQAVNDSV